MVAWLGSVIRRYLGGAQVHEEMDEELRSHLQLRADDLERGGLTRMEAERRARIEFGGVEKFKDQSRDAMGGRFFEILMQDLRFSLRGLRKSPGFALAAMGTLALAIGANAVVFSVMNALIIRPLNVPQAESLYGIWRPDSGGAYQSYPDYLDLRDRNRTLTGLAAFNAATAAMDTGKDPSTAWVYETSGNYFDVLGQRPVLGRFFHAADEHGPNSAPYVVLSYAYWHTHFQDDRSVVGRVVRVNKQPFTILGVAPRDFHGTLLFFNPDFYVPLVEHAVFGQDDLQARGERFIFMTLGHLKPGVTPAQATADLQSIAASLAKSYPKDDGKLGFSLARPSLYGDYLGRPVRGFMTGLMLLAGLILLAACANLGSLFAARAADRSREVALRLALGSSRTRILRGLFTEAMLIALAGGAVGLAASVALLRELSAWAPFPQWPIHLEVNPDAHVYLVAVLLTVASGLLFGVVPVRQVLRTNPYEVVKAGTAGRLGRRVTVRDVLLVVQIAICGVLVTSSMVAMRSLARSMHANFGFDTQNTLEVETDLSMSGYSGDRVAPMQKRILEAAERVPGVERVGLADALPLGAGTPDSAVFADNAPDLTPSHIAAKSFVFKVSPEYLQAAGTALLAGRQFTWADDRSSPRVAIVNGQFAREVFGTEARALGGYFRMPDGARVEVVGFAIDGKYQSLTETPRPAMFLPILQAPSTATVLIVRSGRDAQALGAALRSAIRGLDAGLPVDIHTRVAGIDTLLFGPRMATVTLGVLGVMGAMLSITGIFGMAAYSVSRRLRELGIRMALGAQRKEVLQAALGRALRLLAIGSTAGLILGILASRLLAHIVYEATPRDPLVVGGVVLTMVGLGLVATWIPAQRALGVDPMMLLREE
ncbi:MAG TPA: ABC transporter permease [Acidobacteriaceae bacterium]|nr:ABC transporter permease [Acidobacteriaceae bacterium]